MDLDIVYHIHDARQFWEELEDILHVSASSTLTLLDTAVRNFVSFCASYHEQYLQTPVQLEHACSLLLDSEIFNFHSDRLSSLVVADALSNTDPHAQLILHNLLLLHGCRRPSFLRSAKKWADLIPLLMDHILLVDVDDGYGYGSPTAWRGGVGVPIEARLRQLSVRILYEVCRVQKFDWAGLKVFTDIFIDRLFELVEVTRDMQDETLNYCLIKLIVALNEQYMLSALQPSKMDVNDKHNRVMQILIRRLGTSKTFGENLIFMLNRTDQSAESRCMQLQILKILYLLFTTPETQEYFYTNDLHVLVDVFIRELVDLDEDSEALRHTYLRVLHPLLTQTQLRILPYKRQQVMRMLESLIAHGEIREVSPTTKRLVARCLGGPWAMQLKQEREQAAKASALASGESSPSPSGRGAFHATLRSSPPSPTSSSASSPTTAPRANGTIPHPLKDERYMMLSKSVDNISLAKRSTKDGVGRTAGRHHLHHSLAVDQRMPKGKAKPKSTPKPAPGSAVHLEHLRPRNESSQSLVSVAGAAPSPTSGHDGRPPSPRRYRPLEPKRHSAEDSPRMVVVGRVPEVAVLRPTSDDNDDDDDDDDHIDHNKRHDTKEAVQNAPRKVDSGSLSRASPPQQQQHRQQHRTASPSPSRHRPAPAPPPHKRRNPPAVPSRSTKAVNAGRVVAAMAVSAAPGLTNVTPPTPTTMGMKTTMTH